MEAGAGVMTVFTDFTDEEDFTDEASSSLLFNCNIKEAILIVKFHIPKFVWLNIKRN